MSRAAAFLVAGVTGLRTIEKYKTEDAFKAAMTLTSITAIGQKRLNGYNLIAATLREVLISKTQTTAQNETHNGVIS